MRRVIIVSLALLLANVLQAAPAAVAPANATLAAVAQNAPANDAPANVAPANAAPANVAQNAPAAVAQVQRANVAQGAPAGVETTQGEPEGRVKGQQVVAGGQRSISLAEALRIAIGNNLDLKNSRNLVKKGEENISENRARLLPQINAAFGFNDNFEPPVSVTDGSAYGNKYNVTQTLQFNASGSLQLQMPLYSKTLYTALAISKTMLQLNKLSYEKAREEIMMQLANLYYLIQNTTEQIAIIKDNIGRMEELEKITSAFVENGFSLAIDRQRVSVRLENLRVQFANAEAMLAEQYNMLKYIMDLSPDENIAVEEKSVESIDAAQTCGLSEDLYELQLVRAQENLAGEQVKLAKEAYLPTLMLTGNFTYSAFTDNFKNWFRSGESNHWYKSNGLGLSLRVPIFSGFERRSKLRKAKLDLENARITTDKSLKGLQMQYANAVNDLMNNERNYIKQRDNYNLAESIYRVTSDRYKEGIVSMVEVLQDEMSMSEAQNNYLTAHYNYQISNLSVLKLTGRLNTLLKENK